MKHPFNVGVDFLRILARHNLLNSSLRFLIGFMTHDIKQHTLHVVVKRAVLSCCIPLQFLYEISPQTE